MFLGIDIGSTTTKAAIITGSGRLVGSEVINMGTGSDSADIIVDKLLKHCSVDREEIRYTVATGYGRLLCESCDEQLSEISCHAKGAHFLYPAARCVIDIGGQDAKVIRMNADGRLIEFVMNEKCAAGTGRFFEVMGRIFHIDLNTLSDMAICGASGVKISNICAVFAETEVISRLASGEDKNKIAKGIFESIAERVTGLCHRILIEDEIIMTGGVANLAAMPLELERGLGRKIIVPESPQTVGAVGAAVFALDRYASVERTSLCNNESFGGGYGQVEE